MGIARHAPLAVHVQRRRVRAHASGIRCRVPLFPRAHPVGRPISRCLCRDAARTFIAFLDGDERSGGRNAIGTKRKHGIHTIPASRRHRRMRRIPSHISVQDTNSILNALSRASGAAAIILPYQASAAATARCSAERKARCRLRRWSR